MNNNIIIRTNYQKSDKKWYLNIVPPIYLNGKVVVQEGTLYFKQIFDSQKEAYEFAKDYLISIGISQEIANNKVDYK